MKSFFFSCPSVTHACILAAREQGFSVSLNGDGVAKKYQSEGGYLHFENIAGNEYFIYQGSKSISDKSIGLYEIEEMNIKEGEYGEGMRLDTFIEKFSQKPAEVVVEEYVKEKIKELEDGRDVGSDIYTQTLIKELWERANK